MGTSRDDWPRLKELFDTARTLEPGPRAAFVAEACGEDQGLRQELESLLASYDAAGTFLETPAIESVPDRLADGLLAGRQLGPYELSSLIAAGGMGEVYAARDVRLDRQVAVKVMTTVAADPRGRARFQREARAIAALAHRHICTLHDVGSIDGLDFLVMERLDGETLAARLQRGAVPPDDAITLAIQVASALDAAHRAGIIHRDLKPGNVMLTAGGAKLLDFGLATTRGPAVTLAPGGMSGLTAPGTIIGTAQYMAPEQVEGKETDARTDIFAFGTVLYELFAGRKAFDGASSASLIAAILTAQPPPVTTVRPELPPGLDYALTRCLAKAPDDRWQTMRDLKAELERVQAGAVPPGAGRPAISTASQVARWVLPLAASAALLGAGGFFLRPAAPTEPVRWLSILPPAGGFDLSPSPVVSPDGRSVIFKAQDASHRTQIWLKRLDAPAATPIPGTEGTELTSAPFWSPDGRSIGFFASGQLKRVDVDGGALRVLARAPEARGGTWTPGGVLIYNADTQNLMQVPAMGGGATRLADATDGVRLFPHALADGRHYLFTSGRFRDLGTGIFLASLETSEVRKLNDARSPAAIADGHLFFVQQRALFAQPVDVAQWVTTGPPAHVADGIGVGAGNPFTYPFSVASGVAAFWGGRSNPTTQLTWFDRTGRRLGTAGEAVAQAGFTLDRNGRRAVVEIADVATSAIDLWTVDANGAAGAARLTANGAYTVPLFTPDSTRLIVMERGRGIVSLPAGGAGESTVVVAGASSKWPSDMSADGRLIAFADSVPEGWRLWTVAADGSTPPRVYRQASFTLAALTFSPDGRHVAYMSDESGRFEIYVDGYPDPGDRVRVSSEGGSLPRWRPDGRELYYLAPDRTLMAVGVAAGGGTAGGRPVSDRLTFSTPQALFDTPGVHPDYTRLQYTPSPDGSRFLMNARVPDPAPAGIAVITQWRGLLK